MTSPISPTKFPSHILPDSMYTFNRTPVPSNLGSIQLTTSQWQQIKTFSNFIHEFVVEIPNNTLTKESFDDLFNMARVLNQVIESVGDSNYKQQINQHNQQQQIYLDQLGYYQSHSNTTSPAIVGNPPGQLVTISSQSLGPSTTNNSSGLNVKVDMGNSATSVGGGGSNSSSSSSSPLTQSNGLTVKNNNQNLSTTIIQTTPTPNIQQQQQQQQQQPPPPQLLPNNHNNSKSMTVDAKKNYNGEIFFDDVSEKPRRRRRTVYSAKRNLKCQHCQVTETPEWRRGPNGDHTLCNACGLHYAKTLKKQKKLAEEKEKERLELEKDKLNNNNNNNGIRKTDEIMNEQQQDMNIDNSQNQLIGTMSTQDYYNQQQDPNKKEVNRKHSIDFVMSNV